MVTTTKTNTKTKTKKKRGRPSRTDLQKQIAKKNNNKNPKLPKPKQQKHKKKNNPNSENAPQRQRELPPRSTRNIPIFAPEFLFSDDEYEEEKHFPNSKNHNHDDVSDDDDDEDERRLKKVRRLPSPDQDKQNDDDSDDDNAVTPQEEDDDEDEDEDEEEEQEEEKGLKATDNNNNNSRCYGATSTTTTTSALDGAGGPTTGSGKTKTPLPDKKLILLILDKLQKKDTRGVFADPVDPEELPDYHEIIEKPMDFGTLRRKLDDGAYSLLEQLEADVYLICANAMEYNLPSTIFFRQARSIQELAKKEFETLRQESLNTCIIEPPPRPRRGRPPGSRNKKPPENTSRDHAVPESSSDATPASREDDAGRSNSYNLRKGPSLYRFPRNLEFYFDSPASTSRHVPVKYGKRQVSVSDDCRRDTYMECDQVDSGQGSSVLGKYDGFDRQLVAVGLGSNYGYARSLSQFAADLGPVVWRIVSKKIRSILPPGVEFGPGWVRENEVSSAHLSPIPEKPMQSLTIPQASTQRDPHNHHPIFGVMNSAFTRTPSPSSNDKTVEARGVSPSSEWSSLKYPNGVTGSTSSLQTQQGLFLHPGMNGFNGGYGSGFNFQEGMARSTASAFEASKHLSTNRGNPLPYDFNGAANAENDCGSHGVPYWQNLSIQERWDRPYTAEPSVGSHGSGSRSPSLTIGSSPQLDLVLQL